MSEPEHGIHGLTEERRDSCLAQQDAANERFLAVALPLMEYGSTVAADAVARSMRAFSERSIADYWLINTNWIGSVVIGRLGWALASYSLDCARFGRFVRISTISLTRNIGVPSVVNLGVDTLLRYQPSFGTFSTQTLGHYRDWIASLPLTGSRLYLFAPGSPSGPFSEADLILAMLATMANRRALNTVGLHREVVQRFAARLGVHDQRALMTRLFGVDDANLNATLEDLYQALCQREQVAWSGIDVPHRLLSES